MAQIANTLAKHPQGSLLSNTEVNPQESLKAAALRSGKDLVSHIIQNTIKVSVANQEIEITNKPFDLDAGENEKGKSKENLSWPKHQPKLAYPAKVKNDQQEEQFKKFLEMFKLLHINVPFVEAFAQMPR